MKIIVCLLFLLPNFLSAEVIYEKLGFTDIDGREVVSLRIDGGIDLDDEIIFDEALADINQNNYRCLLYTSPSPRDGLLSRMPSSA